MENRKDSVEEKKDNFDFSGGKDFLNKGAKKKKPLRREKDKIRRVTRECLKDWRGIDFDEDEI